MRNFKIHFDNPWLLLVFLLGVAFTALLYFRLTKRYRKNRNRITSIVLHTIVLALSVLTLAGTLFTYTVPNDDNQIILLVDMSDTENQSETARADFIQTVLNMGQYDNYSIGIVTFGFDQVTAVKLDKYSSVDEIMEQFSAAELPDVSATNIAAALKYTANLFYKPESAKIVLITDGKETDEKALSVIRGISTKGIKVDVANIPSKYEGRDMQLIEATLPDYHIIPGSECPISVTIQANNSAEAFVEFYDNDVLIEKQAVNVTAGLHVVSFLHTFENYGLHDLTFRLSVADDVVDQNNYYKTFINLENFNNILILEHKDGESAMLEELLTGDDAGYNVKVINVGNVQELPKSVVELCDYDQVILNNVANEDMPEGFINLLNQYVSEYGGGMFTVGGMDENPNYTSENDRYIAHAYNRTDMRNTLYGKMLPVDIINYTPPVAVMVIVDRSGSMGTADGDTGSTKYDLALSGAAACLDALSERDYFGLMTLDDDFEILLPLTPRSQESRITKTINDARDLGVTGGTVFPAAIDRACRALLSVNVARRHVILVTDGIVGKDQEPEYLSYINHYNKNNDITFSVVGVGVSEGSSAAIQMKTATDAGKGRIYPITNLQETIRVMREDLNVPEIKEINYETFFPTSLNLLSPLFNGVAFNTEKVNDIEKSTPYISASLDGFFGSKVKAGAELLLVGDFNVPLYAQWKYGNGMVGSFMCDLNGTWSPDFLTSTDENKGAGKRFILNAISALLPSTSIRESDIRVTINQDNYTNYMSVFTKLEEGQRVVATLTKLNDSSATPMTFDKLPVIPEGDRLSSLPFYMTSPLDSTTNYSRCGFIIKDSGVYELHLQKVDQAGTMISEYREYRVFSYSEEYLQDQTVTDIELAKTLSSIASAGNGVTIANNEDPYEIFTTFEIELARTFDPRYLFMILALVLFLGDIAVRKFKFKWPHEIIRNYREKKQKGGKTR